MGLLRRSQHTRPSRRPKQYRHLLLLVFPAVFPAVFPVEFPVEFPVAVVIRQQQVAAQARYPPGMSHAHLRPPPLGLLSGTAVLAVMAALEAVQQPLQLSAVQRRVQSARPLVPGLEVRLVLARLQGPL
jgi:hypothetical protein